MVLPVNIVTRRKMEMGDDVRRLAHVTDFPNASLCIVLHSGKTSLRNPRVEWTPLTTDQRTLTTVH